MNTSIKRTPLYPILEKQFAEVQKNIDNMLNAIQQGIFTPSTKERLEALEREKSELSVQIIKEEMSKPKLIKKWILFWIYKFRKLNPKRLDHRRRLVNSFVNSLKDRLGKDVDVMTYSALERSLIKVKTKQVYFSQSCIPCNRVIIWNQRRKNTSSA